MWIWRAWHRLHLDRPLYGGGLGPMVPGRIAWRAVQQWSEFHDYDRAEFSMLDACLIAMDGTYLDWWRMQQPQGGR